VLPLRWIMTREACVPFRKSSLFRLAQVELNRYLEPGEQIEVLTYFYNHPPATGTGVVGGGLAMIENRKVRAWFAALTDRRLLFLNASTYSNKPQDLAWTDARPGAAARRLTDDPRKRTQYGAVEYRRPTGEALQLWYSGLFSPDVTALLAALNPAPAAG
jgi:hypothetical protein